MVLCHAPNSLHKGMFDCWRELPGPSHTLGRLMWWQGSCTAHCLRCPCCQLHSTAASGQVRGHRSGQRPAKTQNKPKKNKTKPKHKKPNPTPKRRQPGIAEPRYIRNWLYIIKHSHDTKIKKSNYYSSHSNNKQKNHNPDS